MNARAVAAWTAACLFIVLFTTNPAYKVLVLAAAFAALAAGAGVARMRRLLLGVALIASFDTILNFVSAHLGSTTLFALPDAIPALGGRFTLEALVFGVVGGVTIAAAILSAAPFSLLLEPHDVMDALPASLARTGTAIAASMNLVPSIGGSFVEVTEAQRLRGWRPRGPRSWAEIVVPVVLTGVESSIQLAESMEARGFGSGPRTAYRTGGLRTADWIVVGASALSLIAFAGARIAGLSGDWFAYPALTPPPLDVPSVLGCLLLFTPAWLWRRRD